MPSAVRMAIALRPDIRALDAGEADLGSTVSRPAATTLRSRAISPPSPLFSLKEPSGYGLDAMVLEAAQTPKDSGLYMVRVKNHASVAGLLHRLVSVPLSTASPPPLLFPGCELRYLASGFPLLHAMDDR